MPIADSSCCRSTGRRTSTRAAAAVVTGAVGSVPNTHWSRPSSDSSEPSQVNAWWERWPLANVGLLARESLLVVVDLDLRPGHGDVLKDFRDAHGDLVDETVVAMSGKGYHLYFRHRRRRQGCLAARIGSGRGSTSSRIATRSHRQARTTIYAHTVGAPVPASSNGRLRRCPPISRRASAAAPAQAGTSETLPIRSPMLFTSQWAPGRRSGASRGAWG